MNSSINTIKSPKKFTTIQVIMIMEENMILMRDPNPKVFILILIDLKMLMII